MRLPMVRSQKVALLFAICAAVFAMSACCQMFPYTPFCPKPGLAMPARPGRPFKAHTFTRRFGTLAGGATAATLAPFYGNLQAVVAPNMVGFGLIRQSDCSLGYGEYTIGGTATSPVANVTNTIPNYERIIHNNAFLATTPDLYPNGCGAATQGTSSALLTYLGQQKSNGNYLGAQQAGSGIYTYSVSASYAITVGTSLAPDIEPYSLASGDLNNDGNIDLISMNTDGQNSSVSVFISNGDGTYKAPANYELPNQVITFGVVDDLNGDGNPDVLVNSSTQGFLVFLGKGDGTLNAPVAISDGGQTTNFTGKFITADVNNDKKRDIITEQGQIFLGQGDGITYTFAGLGFPAVSTASNGLAPGIVAADFNNDGNADIATDDGSTIRTYMGNGHGGFTVGPAYAAISNRGLITGTDIDGDGNLDLYSGYGDTVGYGGDDYLPNIGYPLMGNGDGTFAGAPSLPVSYGGSNLADLNGDGRPDLVAFTVNSNNQGVLTSYLTQNNGIPAQAAQQLVLPAGQTGGTPVLGQFTGGTTEDVFWVGTTPIGLTFNMSVGNGDGSFQLPTTATAPSLVPSGLDIQQDIQGVQTVDVNHDGKADLVYWFFDIDGTTNTYYEGFAVQLGNGDGTFQAPKTTLTYNSTTPIFDEGTTQLAAIYDVNKDNFPDVFYVV
ncbi:MAG: VCBS repeat-containing protein, partial [Candidatus Acidiferrales bacterium]